VVSSVVISNAPLTGAPPPPTSGPGAADHVQGIDDQPAGRPQITVHESPRRYVPRLVIHAKWAGYAQREQPKVTRGRRCVSQKVAVAEVGGCRRTRQ
jgi:hypothetical protein